jgi:hypothetical protein
MVAAALFAMVSPASVPLVPNIVHASLFKNSFAVVTREMAIPGAGEHVLTQVPQSALGTLWFATTGSVRIESVIGGPTVATTEVGFETLVAVLRGNIDRRVRLVYRPGASTATLEGKLLQADGEIIGLETERGVTFVNAAGLERVESLDGQPLALKRSVATNQFAVRIRTTGGAGTVRMLSLERGFGWSPAYQLDISDPKRLTLISRATLVNDLGPVERREVSLITGFPNLPFAQVLEPLITGRNVRGLDELNTLGAPPAPGMGGFDAQFTNRAAFSADAVAQAMTPAGGLGEQREDLFFYRLPNVTLKAGERGYYILFRTETDYSHLYTLDVPDPVFGNIEYRGLTADVLPVMHQLKFRNTAGQPLTTGPATIFQKGEIIGQDTQGYVPAGSNAEVTVNRALDIRAEAKEFEVSRERGAVRVQENVPPFDRLTVRGEIVVRNAKPEAVELRIRKYLTGKVLEAGGGEATSPTGRLNQLNPTSVVEWSRKLEAGKEIKLEYRYELLVRAF